MPIIKYTLSRRIAAILTIMLIVVINTSAFALETKSLITERFGGTAPGLDHEGVMQSAWFGYYAGNGHTDSNILYHQVDKPYNIAQGLARRNSVFFDVHAIPVNTQIIKAVYVMPVDGSHWAFGTSAFSEGISIYEILDPSGTGMWNPNNIGTRTKNTDTPWTTDGTFADCVNPEPVQTIYGIGRGKKQFYKFNITDLVQGWVNQPESNMGVTFDRTIPSDKMEDPYMRPYLEITYETDTTNYQNQAYGLNVFHRSGQTFITWSEIPYEGIFYDMQYRIYRASFPISHKNLSDVSLIAEVNQQSGYNARRSEVLNGKFNYIIHDDGEELSDDTGLFVYTVQDEGQFYYAVTSVMEGNENRKDFSQENSLQSPISESIDLPKAVRQRLTNDNGKQVQEYVHWADHNMSYKVGHGFNFMINVDDNFNPDTPSAVEIMLGGRSTNYYNKWAYNEMITIVPDDYMPPTKNMPYDGYSYDSLQTWWSGCRNNYKTQEKGGIFVPYTQNRIMYYLDFVKTQFLIDENRLYVRGGSMGGTGAMNFGLKHPEIFASVHAVVGCPNWQLNIHGVDENYQVIKEGWRNEGRQLWGNPEDNIQLADGTPVWLWMNAGWYALNHMNAEMPFLSMSNGKRDASIQYFPLPLFYQNMKDAKRAFNANIFDGGHSGWDSSFASLFGTIVKNESIPALKNLTIDTNSGSFQAETGMATVLDFSTSPHIFDGDPSGVINGYRIIEWSRKLFSFDEGDMDDMVDLPNRYELAIRLNDNSPYPDAQADITPRRLQEFTVIPGNLYYWENKRLETEEIIQSGTAVADEYSLLTISEFIIEKTPLGNKLIIKKANENENYPPVLAEIGDQYINDGQTLMFEISATDVNNDSLTFSAINLPSTAQFNEISQLFIWTPSDAEGGIYSLTFNVTDGTFSDNENIYIYVDMSAPKLTIETIPYSQTTQAKINLSGQVEDDTKIMGIEIMVENENHEPINAIGTISGNKWFVSDIYLDQGINLITITAWDIYEKIDEMQFKVTRFYGDYTDVRVSTVEELKTATRNLSSNTRVLIADGFYTLDQTLVVGNNWDENEMPLTRIIFQSESGDRNAVVIKRSVSNSEPDNANNLFLIRYVVDCTIKDMTIKDAFYHCIQIQGEQGAESPRLINLHLVDAGEQFIKVSWDQEINRGCDYGLVSDCLIEYTDHARIHPYLNSYYTDGIDVLGGKGWVIKNNIFKNIRAPKNSEMLAGAAVLMWHQSQHTILEKNYFIECDMGVQFGNPSGDPNDHIGGVIRNNIFFRKESGDVAISLNRTQNVKVYHNTIIHNNTFPWTIEYRYTNTLGDISGDIRYNLTDGPIMKRDGSTAYLEGNITDALQEWFINAETGNLHLSPQATSVINQALPLEKVINDIDDELRDNFPDIGADERSTEQPSDGGVYGQLTTNIAGHDHLPVTNATVFIMNDNGTIYTTTTNDEGRFQFTDLPPGEFILQAVSPDFNCVNSNISVIAGQMQWHEIPPLVTGSYSLEDIDLAVEQAIREWDMDADGKRGLPEAIQALQSASGFFR
ncbi:secreted protein containing Peptidase S9, prolyl oligopeptidase active site region domain protein [Candidatus Magnetomorum sp. HK-1]|nr:secreted protein containing Peptidase S9, prolyl oligopeptidase active site region domain protein [Candidatus Magnetomorum sp. HK-1]